MRVCSLLLPQRFLGSDTVIRLSCKCLYPLNHLAGPFDRIWIFAIACLYQLPVIPSWLRIEPFVQISCQRSQICSSLFIRFMLSVFLRQYKSHNLFSYFCFLDFKFHMYECFASMYFCTICVSDAHRGQKKVWN